MGVGILLFTFIAFLLTLVHNTEGSAGRHFTKEAQEFALNYFRQINPRIEWDRWLVNLAGRHTKCSRHERDGMLQIRRHTRDGQSIAGVRSRGFGEENHGLAVDEYIKNIMTPWRESAEYRAQIEYATKVGCAVRPGCQRQTVVVCLFTPNYANREDGHGNIRFREAQSRRVEYRPTTDEQRRRDRKKRRKQNKDARKRERIWSHVQPADQIPNEFNIFSNRKGDNEYDPETFAFVAGREVEVSRPRREKDASYNRHRLRYQEGVAEENALVDPQPHQGRGDIEVDLNEYDEYEMAEKERLRKIQERDRLRAIREERERAQYYEEMERLKAFEEEERRRLQGAEDEDMRRLYEFEEEEMKRMKALEEEERRRLEALENEERRRRLDMEEELRRLREKDRERNRQAEIDEQERQRELVARERENEERRRLEEERRRQENLEVLEVEKRRNPYETEDEERRRLEAERERIEAERRREQYETGERRRLEEERLRAEYESEDVRRYPDPRPQPSTTLRKVRAFTREQYSLTDEILQVPWDMTHLLENLSGMEASCDMLTTRQWPFATVTDIAAARGMNIQGRVGSTPHKGTTEEGMRMVLRDFQLDQRYRSVGCCVIPDCENEVRDHYGTRRTEITTLVVCLFQS